MGAEENPVIAAHKHSSRHLAEISASEKCGCFCCLTIFEPDEITEWIDEGDGPSDAATTAICPRCGIDSVIGSRSGYPIEKDFLKAMQGHWFSNSS